MSMRIVKATESIPVEHPIFLIFGQPGICKTSLGYSAKDPLLLDFDRGSHRAANRRDTALIESWGDVDGLQDAIGPYSTIVVDTVGRCLDLMTADLAANDPKKFPGGNPTQQGWGSLKNKFRTWMSQLRTLGKDVVIIAHDREDKDGDSRIVRPDIVGGSYSEVMKNADFVGYLYMSGKDRLLDFNPTDKWFGKNPGNWKPFKVPAIDKAGSFLATLIEDGKKVLGKISDESAKVVQQVDDWRAAITAYTTTEECNKALGEIQKIQSTVVMPQVKRLLMERTKELKFEYSGEKKAFIEKEAVPA